MGYDFGKVTKRAIERISAQFYYDKPIFGCWSNDVQRLQLEVNCENKHCKHKYIKPNCTRLDSSIDVIPTKCPLCETKQPEAVALNICLN